MKITIFWLAGSGTSTIWKLLAEKTNYKFMSSWDIMRGWAAKEGMTIYDYEVKVVKKDTGFDIRLDDEVKKYWINKDNFIFDSRLAWNFIPDSFKIYLECDKDIRYKRIQNREEQSLEEIASKNEIRELWVVTRYNKLYPEITFPPTNENFDLVIDVSHILPDQIVSIILEQINYENTYS